MYSTHGRDEKCIQYFGKSKHKLKDNIKMDLKATECDDVDWIHLTQDTDQWWALVDIVVPENVGEFSTT
jgi:hypothetical protein